MILILRQPRVFDQGDAWAMDDDEQDREDKASDQDFANALIGRAVGRGFRASGCGVRRVSTCDTGGLRDGASLWGIPLHYNYES